jgi:hypothetical protein
MEDYTDKYLKYKNKYLELKQQIGQNGGYYQTGGLADPKYDAEFAKLLIQNPELADNAPKLLQAQHELKYNADHNYSMPGDANTFDAPKQTTKQKESTTKTVNNTYLYSPYLDPLISYTLPGYKYYKKPYLDTYYTTNVYSPYTYYKSSYRDPYADDYYEEEKPKRRSKRKSKKTPKRKSKKTPKRKSKKTSKRKSKKTSKRKSRK